MNIRDELEKIFSEAMTAAGAPADCPAVVAPAAKPEFGDYQANGAMAAAKKLKTNPRQLAEKIVAAAKSAGKLDAIAEKIEIAGPGFINITVSSQWIASQLNPKSLLDFPLALDNSHRGQTVVVDYSSPNLAKEMHVGHLRSTIIGDALARIHKYLGYKVILQNHVGDWGTQFGMLLAYMKRADQANKLDAELKDIEELYRRAKVLFDSDPEFAAESRCMVVKLQSGDEEAKRGWILYTAITLEHCRDVYRRLGVLLEQLELSIDGNIYDTVRGESAYNDDLANVVADLRSANMLTESQGAQCVFLDEFKGKDNAPLPFLVQKSDEGFLYATTDLAAIRYRVRQLKAERILYAVDVRQSLHFRQLFAVARRAGFLPEGVRAEHVAFGMMLGDDGKPFKTRTGGTVKLMDLLAEAVERAFKLVTDKNPEMPEDQRRRIAEIVGIGAVKYADLSQNRLSDYVFSWDKMLSMDGNTAPYLQYAYARIRSIFRKDGASAAEYSPDRTIEIADAAERTLAIKLMQFEETINLAGETCQPNLLCTYLYDLAGAFMSFYEKCPVLKADGRTRSDRLALCDLVSLVIKKGLELLGIQTVEQM